MAAKPTIEWLQAPKKLETQKFQLYTLLDPSDKNKEAMTTLTAMYTSGDTPTTTGWQNFSASQKDRLKRWLKKGNISGGVGILASRSALRPHCPTAVADALEKSFSSTTGSAYVITFSVITGEQVVSSGSNASHIGVDLKRFEATSAVKSKLKTTWPIAMDIKSPSDGDTYLSSQRFGEWLHARHFTDPTSRNVAGDTAIHVAAYEGNRSVMAALVAWDAEVLKQKTKSKEGDLAIHKAAAAGHMPAVAFLVDLGCSIDSQNDMGVRPVHMAAGAGYAKTIQWFIADLHASPIAEDYNIDTPLHYAARANRTDVVKYLLTLSPVVARVHNKNKYGHAAGILGDASTQKIFAAASKSTTKGDSPATSASPSASAAETSSPSRVVGEKLKMPSYSGPSSLLPSTAQSSSSSAPKPAASGISPTLQKWLLDHRFASVDDSDADGNRPLHMAAYEVDHSTTTLLINAGADTNIQNDAGDTPLHKVISRATLKNGTGDLFDVLVRNGAKITTQNNLGRQPIHVAALVGSAYMIQACLKKGAGANALDHDGDTPLHCAARQDKLATVEYLLKVDDGKASVGMRNKEGKFPIDLAHESTTKKLLAAINVPEIPVEYTPASAIPKPKSNKPVLRGGANAYLPQIKTGVVGIEARMLNWLKDHKFDSIMSVDSHNSTPLHAAAFEGDLAIMNFLIWKSVPISAVNAHGQQAIHKAASKGHLDAVKLLVAYGADENASGAKAGNVVFQAAQRAHMNVLAWLHVTFKVRFTDDETGSHAVHAAADCGSVPVVKFLVDKDRACLTFSDRDGKQPLHTAAAAAKHQMVQWLISNGAKVNVKNHKGETPLDVCFRPGLSDKKYEPTRAALTQAGAIRSSDSPTSHNSNDAASNPKPLVTTGWVTDDEKSAPRMAVGLLDTLASSPFGAGQAASSSQTFPKQSSSPTPTPGPAAASDARASTINMKDISFGDKIGVGTYGEVWRGLWHGTEVAIKKARLEGDQTLNEIEIMQRVRHPNLVSLFGVHYDKFEVYLVMEYMPKGSLNVVLQDKSIALTWDTIKAMALDIARGVNCLHCQSVPVVHRDLKSLNLLVDEYGKVKVADFGLGRAVGTTTMTAQMGTVLWMAPEMMKGKYGLKADVYSFGIVMWELCYRAFPYAGKSSFEVIIGVSTAGLRPECKSGSAPAPWLDLMQRCWAENEDVRPSFVQIIKELSDMALVNSPV